MPSVARAVPHELDRLDARRRRASATGDSRKRSTSRFGLPLGLRAAYSRSTSRLRSRVRVASGSRALEIGRVDDHVGARELAELVQLRAS